MKLPLLKILIDRNRRQRRILAMLIQVVPTKNICIFGIYTPLFISLTNGKRNLISSWRKLKRSVDWWGLICTRCSETRFTNFQNIKEHILLYFRTENLFFFSMPFLIILHPLLLLVAFTAALRILWGKFQGEFEGKVQEII